MVQTAYNSVSTVLLAYPERFYNEYDKLVPFYDELISLIPEDILIWVITNNNQTIDKLQSKFDYKQLNCLGLRGWDEIWLRDCIGIPTDKKTVLKPRYEPNYCKNGTQYDYLEKINKLSRRIIIECLGKQIIDLPLKIDCGNLVCNGKSMYMTDKVLEDNGILSPNKIENILFEATGLKPIFIGNNRNDSIGHADAYFNFIDNDSVVIADYPSFPFLKADIDFIKDLDEHFKANSIERIKLYDRPVYESGRCDCNRKMYNPCFYSARGNYINYLRINNTIILPEYNLSIKKESNYYNRVNQEILEGLGFEVKRINCDLLSKYGGVLHCISFTA